MQLKMKPVTQAFKLSGDEEGLATVTIRQTTNGDTIKRAALWEKQQWTDSGLTINWNRPAQKRYDAFLTIVGLDNVVDEDGAELLKFREGKNGPVLDMSQTAFNTVWDALPSEVCDEIYGFIYEVNPNLLDTATGESTTS